MATKHNSAELTPAQEENLTLVFDQLLAPRLRAQLIERILDDGPLTIPAAIALADRLAAAARSTHYGVEDRRIGPFYDTTGLRTWLGSSRQALAGRVQRGNLIACQLADGSWVYPTWQFHDDSSINKEHLAIWRALRGPADDPHADPWTCALWMRAPHPALDELTPVDWINASRNLDQVLTLARRDAARWAQ